MNRFCFAMLLAYPILPGSAQADTLTLNEGSGQRGSLTGIAVPWTGDIFLCEGQLKVPGNNRSGCSLDISDHVRFRLEVGSTILDISFVSDLDPDEVFGDDSADVGKLSDNIDLDTNTGPTAGGSLYLAEMGVVGNRYNPDVGQPGHIITVAGSEDYVFQSDIDPAGAPEPSSLALVGGICC